MISETKSKRGVMLIARVLLRRIMRQGGGLCARGVRLSRGVARRRGQGGANQRFHLLPDFGIALDFDMRLHHQSIPPGIGGLARNWFFTVNGAEISDDVRARGVGGANFAASVQPTVGLVVIRGLRDVWRNQRIV